MKEEVRRELWRHFGAGECPVCRRKKQPKQCFCKTCYFALTQPERNGLYVSAFEAEFYENYRDAIVKLKALFFGHRVRDDDWLAPGHGALSVVPVMSGWCSVCKCCRAQEGFDKCVFCEDGKACPNAMAALRGASVQAPESVKQEPKEEGAMEDTKICAYDGCGKALISTNRSGYCTKHWYESRRKKPANGGPSESGGGQEQTRLAA